GGYGADGKPTDTVFVLSPDSTTGSLGNWQTAEDAKLDLKLPEPRAGAAIVAAPDGLLLIGGTNGTGPVDTIWKSTFDKKSGAPGKWTPQPGKLFAPVVDASAALIGSYVWVFGGTGADGKATAMVQRAEFGTGADPAVLGPNAIIIGGTTADGPQVGSIRANIAPEAPFFQLGLFGATVPALKIDGEIGQQLGYLNANTIGIVDFVLFIIVGWAI